jgi:hypothetical protein
MFTPFFWGGGLGGGGVYGGFGFVLTADRTEIHYAYLPSKPWTRHPVGFPACTTYEERAGNQRTSAWRTKRTCCLPYGGRAHGELYWPKIVPWHFADDASEFALLWLSKPKAKIPIAPAYEREIMWLHPATHTECVCASKSRVSEVHWSRGWLCCPVATWELAVLWPGGRGNSGNDRLGFCCR